MDMREETLFDGELKDGYGGENEDTAEEPGSGTDRKQKDEIIEESRGNDFEENIT